MAFQPSAWADIDGGYQELDTDGGRSKRLCTGLSGAIEPWPTRQTQWAGNQAQILPEQSLHYDVSRYNSSAVDVQGRSASDVDFYNVSQQHVGIVQGQTLFQNHQDLPWPSTDYNSPPSPLQVVNITTPSIYHRARDFSAVENATSSAYDSWNPPSSASISQPTPTSSIPHVENTHEQYHHSDCGITTQYACQGIASGGTSEPEESVDTGNEDTSYELCLGLVRQSFVEGSSLWTTVFWLQSLEPSPRGSLGPTAELIHSSNRLPFDALERSIFLA